MENRHFIWLWLVVMIWATASLVATEFWRVDKGQEALWFAVCLGWVGIVLEFQVRRKREKEEEKEWERKESEMYARQEELEKQEREIYDKQRQYEEKLRKRRKRTESDN